VNVTLQTQVQTTDGAALLRLDGIAFNQTENVMITLPIAAKKLTLNLSLVSTGTNPVTPTTKATFADNTKSTTVTLTKVKGIGVQGVVQIVGQDPSDKAGDVTLVATGSDGNSYGSQSFTVVSVVITANTGTMKQNDDASGIFASLTQPAQLGPKLTRQVKDGPLVGCGVGIEYIGQVSPKYYSCHITLRRFATSYFYVWDMSDPSNAQLQNTPVLHADNSLDALVSTKVTNGFVYDIDTPGGSITSLPANSANSYRANYTEFAQLGDRLQNSVVGNTRTLQDELASPETASVPLQSYAAVSCNASADGKPKLNTTYQSNNDNTGGEGCTLTGVAGGATTCN